MVPPRNWELGHLQQPTSSLASRWPQGIMAPTVFPTVDTRGQEEPIYKVSAPGSRVLCLHGSSHQPAVGRGGGFCLRSPKQGQCFQALIPVPELRALHVTPDQPGTYRKQCCAVHMAAPKLQEHGSETQGLGCVVHTGRSQPFTESVLCPGLWGTLWG